MKNETKLNLLGLFSILFGILAIINTLLIDHFSKAIYFCYIGLILIGIGALRKDNNLVLSQLYILTIPLIIWNIDFFYELILNKQLLGIASYFFEGSFGTLSKTISLQHLITVPLGIYTAKLINKKGPISTRIAISQVVIVSFISLIITTTHANVNCVLIPCMNISLPGYKYLYIIFFVISIYLTKYIYSKEIFSLQ